MISVNKYLFFCLIGIILIMLSVILSINKDYDRLKEDTLMRMGKVEQMEVLLADEKKRSDELKLQIDSVNASIKSQERSKTIIITKYEKNKNSVLGLSSDSSILFLAERLSKEADSR